MTRASIAVGMAVLVSLPPAAQWFSATMPRHQLLQVPALLVLGIVAARGWGKGRATQPTGEWGPALLVLAIGTMMFWMVPRSIDLAASHPLADQLMHLSWFAAGAALSYELPRVPFAVKMALGVHGVAMLGAIGLVYKLYPGLICTAYNLQQQQTTGHALLYVASTLGVGLWVWAIRMAARATDAAPPTVALSGS